MMLRRWGGTIDWTAVNHTLQKFLVNRVGSSVMRPGHLTMIAELGTYHCVQEVSASHKLRQVSKAGRVALPQLAYDIRGISPLGRVQPLFQTRLQVRADRQHLVQPIPRHASLASREKSGARWDQNVGQCGEGSSFGFIKGHDDTA